MLLGLVDVINMPLDLKVNRFQTAQSTTYCADFKAKGLHLYIRMYKCE